MRGAETAWAAGLFEGEGCIALKKPGLHGVLPTVHLVMELTDRDVLERFCAVVACGKVRLRRTEAPNKKAVYSWSIGNRRDVDRLLRAFMPWLGKRRATKARLVLDECAAMDRLCLLCGSEFRGKRSDSRWCCHQHRMAWHERERRKTLHLRLAATMTSGR